MQPLVITLDGPAGSGKSTVARLLAQRLGVSFLDTGAMYRAITAQALACDIDPAREPDAVADLARGARLWFDWAIDPPRLHLALGGHDHDLTDRLRDADVTFSVSDVAANAQVRQVLVESQRRIGQEHPRLVTEGRDQGSVVFPGAQVKFYLDARPEVRAQRRARQLREAGKSADEQFILQDILRRDRRDTTRSDGPLVCPPDAIRLDTSDLGISQVVDLLESQVRQKAPGTGALPAVDGAAVSGPTATGTPPARAASRQQDSEMPFGEAG